MRKRLSVGVLIAVLVFTAVFLALPSSAKTYSGTCGTQEDNLTWSLDASTGVLTIEGSGEMPDYGTPESPKDSPWAALQIPVTKVILPDGLTKIGNNAFYNTQITEIVIPDSVKQIGACAFQSNRKLMSVTIGKGVTDMGNWAFDFCDKITQIQFNATSMNDLPALNQAFEYVGRESGTVKVTVGANVERIPANLFYPGVIGSNPQITTVVFESGSVCHTIGNHAFAHCMSLTAVDLPESVTTIEDSTFNNCQNLSDISLPEGLTVLGESAFSSCHKIEEIVIPKGITVLSKGVFNNCSGLKKVSFEGQLTQIGDKAFYSCSALTELNLPSSLSEIGKNAFYDCDMLATVRVASPSITEKLTSASACGELIRSARAVWIDVACAESIPDYLPSAFEYVTVSTYMERPHIVFSKDEVAHEHYYRGGWKMDETGHWIGCIGCDQKNDFSTHAYENSCDTTCEVCGYSRTVTHSYETQWSKNGSGHWHECGVCGAKKDEAAHIYTNTCDTTCDTCGYTRTVPHNYSTKWSTNQAMHWHECTVCGAKKDEAAHKGGAPATETTAQTCTVCGYVMQAVLGHTHVYDSQWNKSESAHWHECACGQKSDEGEHMWDTGSVTKEPTVDNEGERTFECTVCGMKRIESIARLPAVTTSTTTSKVEETKPVTTTTTEKKEESVVPVTTTTTPTTVPTTTTSEKPIEDEEDARPSFLLPILVFILIVALAIVIVIVVKRKNEQKRTQTAANENNSEE